MGWKKQWLEVFVIKADSLIKFWMLVHNCLLKLLLCIKLWLITTGVGFSGCSGLKTPPSMQEIQVWYLGWEDSLKKEMATHSSIPAWEISWTEKPGGLQLTGLHKSSTWLSDWTVTTITGLIMIPLNGSQPCRGKGACIYQWSYEPCHADTSKGQGHSGEFWKIMSTGGGNGNPLQYSCLENPMNSIKRQKIWHGKMNPPRLEDVQYATGEEWESTVPKWKQCSAMHVSSGESKVRCCKEQYCIGTWNVS